MTPTIDSASRPAAAAHAPAEDGRPVPRSVVVGLSVLTVMSVVGMGLSPYLLATHPIVLVALAPDMHHILLAASQAPFWVLLLVGTVRRVLGMVATYGLLAHFGPAGLSWAGRRWPRLDRVVRWFERLFARVGAPLLVVAPSYGTVMLAGASRMPWRRFLPAMVAGQLAFTAGLLLFGASTAQLVEPLLTFVRTHVWECTAVAVALVGLQRLWSWRRRRSGGLART